jgi:DNA repair photolyase
MPQVIYETKGRAREFNELAINLFTGCDHKCIYCYGADVTHQDKSKFENAPRPRILLDDLEKDAEKRALAGETRRVLLCFVTDPYQHCETQTQLTRKTILALHKHGLHVHILTKGGARSMRDFDILTPGDAYAATLTCVLLMDSLKWEPCAAPPFERIDALKEAHRRGIETWVSFEPVIYPQDCFHLLEMTHTFVGHYKVGTMNYHPHGKTIDWRSFGWEMKRRMDGMGVKYYFKQDLLREMGVQQAEFRQTWECQ